MEIQRLKKIENTASKIASEYIRDHLSEEDTKRFRLVNIVGVKLAPDLSYLDMNVSCFENSEVLTKALTVYANEIEAEIFKKLSLRKKPRVRFRYDASGAHSSEILNTIKDL
jgi:ribosome-binding factor A